MKKQIKLKILVPMRDFETLACPLNFVTFLRQNLRNGKISWRGKDQPAV
jgi:hypothetical protein